MRIEESVGDHQQMYFVNNGVERWNFSLERVKSINVVRI